MVSLSVSCEGRHSPLEMWSGRCSCGAEAACAPFAPLSPDRSPPSPPSAERLLSHMQQIPLMNSVALHYLKNGHLVRFRGMVQDMHNPEFYFETFEMFNRQTKESRICSGKYRDTADVGEFEVPDYNSPKMKCGERQSITVISLPGLNEWAKRIENSQNLISHFVNPPSTSKNQNADPGTKTKRSLDEIENCYPADNMETDSVNNPKKDRHESHKLDHRYASVSREHILNFPIPDEDGKVCIVKVYDQFDNLKLNDMIEVIGYLSIDPALSNHWNTNADSNDEQLDAETLTHNPPPSLVPRIHAIHIEPIKHCNPLLKSPIDRENIISGAKEVREHLYNILTQVLLGDSLAADYLICHLISEVYIRRDVLSLGKFTLNLWKVPSQRYPKYAEQLYELIKSIVTKSHYLPLTTDNLNDLAFTPKKDYECNRLTSGILQLSKNTHLLVDETKMQPGQLNSTGVLNVTTLGNVIQNQKVKYDFKFYTMEYDCDISILIMSEGKSLLPNEASLPIIADEASLEIVNETFDAARHYLTPDLLNRIRTYLTAVRLIDYAIAEEPQFIQEDFVSMRKDDSRNHENDSEDLHRLLVLTRLICLSRGYNTINRECWEIAKDMEKRRFERLKMAR